MEKRNQCVYFIGEDGVREEAANHSTFDIVLDEEGLVIYFDKGEEATFQSHLPEERMRKWEEEWKMEEATPLTECQCWDANRALKRSDDFTKATEIAQRVFMHYEEWPLQTHNDWIITIDTENRPSEIQHKFSFGPFPVATLILPYKPRSAKAIVAGDCPFPWAQCFVSQFSEKLKVETCKYKAMKSKMLLEDVLHLMYDSLIPFVQRQ